MNMVFDKAATKSSTTTKPAAVISTYLRMQGKKISSQDSAYKEMAIQFGNTSSSHTPGQASGSIAEFIVYETILKDKDIAKIESYLALKYGITLEKSYMNSLGDIIWDRKKDEIFSNNIAGIGRDDQATLYQKQGTSSSTTDELTIGINKIASSNSANKSVLNNKDFLIWGDNALPFLIDQNSASAEAKQ